MAQTIKLRRSSTEGKVPTTAQLALGELAINTYDGRIFFEKNDGSATIQHIVTTNSIATGSLTITGSLQADNITIDGATVSSDLDLTIDSAGDITLDADGADVLLKDGGTSFGRFNRTSSDFVIKSETNDKDIVFKGVDNSATITALTLDMSEAGAATFGGGIANAGTIAAGTWNGSSISTTYTDAKVTSVSAGDGIDVDTTTGAVTVTAETATTTNPGVVELATTAETTTGTDTARAVTPDGLKDGYQGSTNVTTLGTIGTGTWNGTAIASAYLDSDTAHLSGTQTFSGAKTFTGDSKFTGQSNFQIMGDSNAIFISSSNNYDPSGDEGKLYIGGYQSGNTSLYGIIIDYEEPVVKLDIELRTSNTIDVDSTTQSTSKTTGCVQIAGGVGIAKTLNVGEDVVAFASSDERYKDLITPIENPNEKIKLLSGNTFVWNDKHEVFKGKKDIGVIAQEVEKVLPEIVETRDNGYKAVKYEKIVALLIESNKELIKRVEELESKIK